MRKKKEASSSEGGGTPGWMATFSDLNFNMITFFVLLLSMSSMDERRFSDVFGAEVSNSEENLRPEPPMGRSPLPAIVPARGSWIGYTRSIPVDDVPGMSGRTAKEGSGLLNTPPEAMVPDREGVLPDEAFRKALERVRDILTIEALQDDEIRVSVDDTLFFEGAEYRPSPRSDELLRAIAKLANDYGGNLQVQAHRGDWEVAAKRSAAVAQVLVRVGVPGDRVAADVIAGPEGSLNFALKRTIPREGARPSQGRVTNE